MGKDGKTYILRHIPEELWANVKGQAAVDRKPLRTAILELLTGYAAKFSALNVPQTPALTEEREE